MHLRENKRHSFPKLFLLLICGFPTFLFSQSFNFHFNNISVESGLSHREILDIAQDERGFIWLATTAGLDRFDGQQFIHFTNSNEEDSPFNIIGKGISGLEKLDERIVLFFQNTKDSIEILNSRTLKSQILYLNEKHGLAGQVLDFFVSPKEGIFILTKEENQLSIFQFENFESGFVFQHSFQLDIANSCNFSYFKILKSTLGNYWIYDACSNAVIRLSHTSQNDFPIVPLFANQKFNLSQALNIFHEDSKGNIWLGFRAITGLLKLSPDNSNFEFFENADSSLIYKRMWEDEKGNLLVNAAQGFYTQSLTLIKPDLDTLHFQKVAQREPKIVQIIGRDFMHQFHIATHSGYYHVGVENPDIQHFLKLKLEKGEFGHIIRGFTSDRNGSIYFNSGNRWFELNKSAKPFQLRQLTLKDNFGNPIEKVGCCANMIYDDLDYLWGVSCGENQRGRLHRYHPKTENWKTWNVGRDSLFIRILLKDKDQQFWAVTFDSRKHKREAQLWQFKPNEAPYFFPFPDANPENNPLAGTIARNMIETQDGTIWIATTKGLASFNSKEPLLDFVQNEVSQNFTSEHIFTLKEGQNGLLYLSARGGGLNIFDPKSGEVTTYDANDGLPNNNIAGIEQIDDNRFLLGTEYGLSIFDESKGTFYNFLEEDGLSHNEFNRLSSFKDENDNYYFGGLNGVNMFRFEDLKIVPHPKPVLTKFYKYDRATSTEIVQLADFDLQQSFAIEPGALYFGFEYFLPDFSKPEEHLYSTWLEGYEPNWTAWKPRRDLQFGILPPGNYILHIRAKDAKNNFTESLQIAISIQDYFYNSWWFLGSLLLLFGALIYFFTKNRTQQQALKKAQQERTERKMAELELHALQAQMNPHFVFNALGAIQFYIRNNDNEIADAYLAKFAHLMRLFLESSKNKFILLEEEIKLIQLYIELEKIRFEDKFEVIYEFDEDLDIYTTEIPSLLLQPFIENAINHGLFHKKEKGYLKLSIRETEDETLICIIEDNGVGRKRAAALRKRSIRNYKSRGTQIVNERLEVLKQTEDFNIDIEVRDLDKNASDVGTFVEIRVKEVE